MKVAVSICVLLCFVGVCGAQTQPALCPRHIETPFYPQIAKMAHVMGKVIVAVTVDADGKVSDAKVINRDNFVKLLGANAVENIRHWTFVRPPTVPYTETITYDYEMDSSGKVRGTQVYFDLPALVTILAEPAVIQTTQSRNR